MFDRVAGQAARTVTGTILFLALVAFLVVRIVVGASYCLTDRCLEWYERCGSMHRTGEGT